MQDQGLDGFSGFLWMRKTVEIPASWAGKELKLDLAVIDDNDFTYFNGAGLPAGPFRTDDWTNDAKRY